MPSTKRSVSDSGNFAECYYNVLQTALGAKKKVSDVEWKQQANPFNPVGFTESSESIDLDYAIIEMRKVAAQWTTMTGYKSFASE
jgi:hypothetical protein